jgi:hypothetical protein
MKHLKTQKQLNEEINAKQALKVGAFAGLMGLGIAGSMDTYKNAKKVDIEYVSGQEFKQYDLYVNSENFSLNISEDGIISSKFQKSSGSGKNRTTTTYVNVTIPKGTTEIWHDTKIFEFGNGVFVSSKEIKDGKKIKISDLTVKEDTKTYTIYSTPIFCSIDHIIVNKDHKEGDEFTIGGIPKTFIWDKISNNVYLFGFGFGGKFGGSGAGSEY